MAVLITGGTGFIGVNIAEELADEGQEVILLARKPPLPEVTDSLEQRKGKTIFFKGDILDPDSLDQVIRTYAVDTIIHSAVITPDDEREKNESKMIAQVNYMGSIEVLEAAKRAQVQKVLYLSSGSVYGDASYGDPWLSEESTFPRPNALYGINKFAGERAAVRYREIFDMNIIVGRVGGVFGPWERYTGVRDTLSGPFFATRFAVLGETAVLPRPGCKDWVYSRDIAKSAAAMLAADTLSYDVYNLSSGYVWTVAEWCEKLKEAFPSFDYRIADSDHEANIDLFEVKDRNPLLIDRLKDDVGYTPIFDLDRSFSDYMEWIEGTTKFWVNPS